MRVETFARMSIFCQEGSGGGRTAGRAVHYYDMPVVRSIIRDAARNDYRFSSLVLGIVKPPLRREIEFCLVLHLQDEMQSLQLKDVRPQQVLGGPARGNEIRTRVAREACHARLLHGDLGARHDQALGVDRQSCEQAQRVEPGRDHH